MSWTKDAEVWMDQISKAFENGNCEFIGFKVKDDPAQLNVADCTFYGEHKETGKFKYYHCKYPKSRVSHLIEAACIALQCVQVENLHKRSGQEGERK